MEPLNGDAGQPPAQNGSIKGLEQVECPALCLRLLCPQFFVPALIGKKGENIKRIRRERGATVSVADAVPGCEERVVLITGERLDAEGSTSAADALCAVFSSICSLQRRREDHAAAAAAAAPPPPAPPSRPAGSGGGASAGEEAAAPTAANGDSTAAAPHGDGAADVNGGCAAAAASAETADAVAAAAAAAADSDAPSSSNGAAAAAAAAGARGAASTAGDSGATTPTAAAAAAGGPPAAPPAQQLQRLEARILVDSCLVGFLVGKGGGAIKETMAKSGAAVRVLPKMELPACACMGDEVMRVSGTGGAVQAALRLLAGQIKAHPMHFGGHHPGSLGAGGHHLQQQQQQQQHLQQQLPMMGMAGMAAGSHLPMDMPYMQHLHQHPAAAAAAAMASASSGGGGYYSAGSGGGMSAFSGTAVEAMFRLLAPVTRTGNIIGKGGEHVRRVRAETGARIKVFDPSPGSEERVVGLTSTEDALSPYCAAQDGLIRCVIALTAGTAYDSPLALHRVRLLTAQASVGMVLGKRGATVSQLRHETGASIKVVPSDAIAPAFGGGMGSEDESEEGGSVAGSTAAEEVIQVEGSVQQCVAALRGVATLLRGWQIRRLLAQQQHEQERQYGGLAAVAAAAAMMQQHALPHTVPVSPTAGTIRSPESPGIMGLHLPSTLNSPQQVQPGSYLMPSGVHHMQRYPSQQGQVPGMQGAGGGRGRGGGRGGSGGGGALGQQQFRGGGRGGGVRYVYHLNNAQVGAVLGKGGAHIAQIRGMSGARVLLQGELEGGGRALMVVGQPEQCHAAHSMANAFLNMGRCDPAYPEPM